MAQFLLFIKWDFNIGEKMAGINTFNKLYKAYDEWFVRNSELYDSELQSVRELMPKSFKGLEIGVGTGKFATPLGIKTGVEPSEKMAEVAKNAGIEVYDAVAERLPFYDASFNMLLMVTTICFVDSVQKTFSEAFRVLENGGCFLVGFVDRESELGREYQKNREKSRFYNEATFFSTDELIKKLKSAGFTITDFRQTLLPNKPTSLVINGYGDGAFVVIKALK